MSSNTKSKKSLVFSSPLPETLATPSNSFATPSNSAGAANSSVNSTRTKPLILSPSRKNEEASLQEFVCDESSSSRKQLFCKATPSAKRRSKPALPTNRNRCEASSRVKAMADESLLVCRKAETEKNLMLQRQQIAFTAWLNFVFKQPLKPNNYPALRKENAPSTSIDPFRTPKPQRIKSLKPPFSAEASRSTERYKRRALVAPSGSSLNDVCPLSELRQRLSLYMTGASVDEVVMTMAKVSTYIDEGRLRMREKCAIITDVALRKKAIQVLMNYDPAWLKVGLYIVLGHSDLATKDKPCIEFRGEGSVENKAEYDTHFLKLVIEKNFLADLGLSKLYASNKGIDGLYRAGYYEALGKVILKRILLFVLALDRAKMESSYPLIEGIDSVDGGSSRLFCRNSSVKSSRQALQDFLSDVMHGEGDVLYHLSTIGYHVSHVQMPLSEYDFCVTNLIEDLQDGVRMCRLIQILFQDTSALMNVRLPSDHYRKRLHNCTVAFNSLMQVGVSLKDDDENPIVPGDLAFGNTEKILSLLWNIFVDLQMPLLINKEKLKEEIVRIRSSEDTNLAMFTNAPSTTDMICKWIQEVCATYGKQFNGLKTLFSDWTPFVCLIDFYVPGYLPQSFLEENELTNLSRLKLNSVDEVSSQKLRLVQDIIKGILGIPEFFQGTEAIESNIFYNERSLTIMFTLFSAQLLKGNLEAVTLPCISLERLDIADIKQSEQTICTNLNEGESATTMKLEKSAILIQSYWRRRTAVKNLRMMQAFHNQDNSAVKIQSAWKRKQCQLNFHNLRHAAITVQSYWRSCLAKNRLKIMRQENQAFCNQIKAAVKIQSAWRRMQHHSKYLTIKRATIKIQIYCRRWLTKKYIEIKKREALIHNRAAVVIQRSWKLACAQSRLLNLRNAAITIQSNWRCRLAKNRLQQMQREKLIFYIQTKAATKIQCSWKRAQDHLKYIVLKQATVKIQSYWRSCLARGYFKVLKENSLLKSYERKRAAVKIQCAWKRACCQSQFRNWRLAATRIQSTFRMYVCKKSFKSYMEASIVVQSFIRAELALQNYKQITHNNRNDCTTISASKKAQVVQILTKYTPTSDNQSAFLKIHKSVLKLQGWWRKIFTRQTSSAMVIQAHIRGWICRKAFSKAITRITCIQAYWRSYRARQLQIHDDQQQLSSLRARIKVSATNVDDNLRLGNRLTRALEELAKHRTVSGVRHVCVTLDVSTQHSKRCCHQLVDAGAIDKILKVIVFSNRSMAYKETLKRAFSVLSNIACYPEFAQAIVDTPGSVTIIAEQVLRNKDELFQKAADILKKLCAVQNGLDALGKLHSIIRRMQYLSQSLDKKLETEARNLRKFQKMEVDASRKMAEKRLKDLLSQHKAIIELLQLVSANRNTQAIESRNSEISSSKMTRRCSSRLSAIQPLKCARCPLEDRSNR